MDEREEDVRYGAPVGYGNWRCACKGGAPWHSLWPDAVKQCQSCGLTNPTEAMRALADVLRPTPPEDAPDGQD